ncbi:MFS transporter [Micromonospora sp. NPDC047620]|uniref:MFS transporter n=1 Tax=Micromonospora sp. NPDC047620 TaxID=3364251 RepID=UPI00371FDDCA
MRTQTGLLLAHTVVVQAVTFMLRPASAYRALDLDVPAAWLGVLGASFAVVPLVLAVPSGQAVDRFGERRIVLAGSGLLAAAGACFVLFADSVAGLVVTSMVLGTGHLFAVVGQQALVANRTAADRYDTAFGYYTFAASLGQTFGPGLIVAFGGDHPIPDTGAIFLGATALTLPLLVAAVFLRPSAQHRQAAGPAAGGLGGRAMSLRLTGNRLGQVLIPSAAGALAAGAGAAGVLACTAAGPAGAAVAATGLHRPPPEP